MEARVTIQMAKSPRDPLAGRRSMREEAFDPVRAELLELVLAAPATGQTAARGAAASSSARGETKSSTLFQ